MLGQAVILSMMGMLLTVSGCMTSAWSSHKSNVFEQADLRGDSKNIEEITNAFTSFEHALRQSDLDGVMVLFAEGYRDRQFGKDDLRAEWVRTFSSYRDISATHLVTRVEAHADSPQPMAFVTCSGSVSAISNSTGKRILLDSWIGEVHHMIKENGRWRVLGNAWEARHPGYIWIAGHQH